MVHLRPHYYQAPARYLYCFMKHILTLFALAIFNIGYSQLACPAKTNGRFGFIDTSGKWIVQPKYDSLIGYYNGYAWIFKKGKKGLVDGMGNIILKTKYDDIGFVEDSMVDVTRRKKYIFYNLSKKKFVGNHFEESLEYNNGIVAIMNSRKQWGFMNKEGKIVIPFQFDDVDYCFENDTLLVVKNNRRLLINRNGKILGDAKPEIEYHEPYRYIGSIGNLGVINNNSDTIMKQIYHQVEWFWYGRKIDTSFWFEINGKYGIADTSGRWLIKPVYNKIWRASSTFFAVNKNGVWGFINNQGMVIIDFSFDEVHKFCNGYSTVRVGNKWGVINEKGEWLISPTFEYLGDEFRNIYTNFKE